MRDPRDQPPADPRQARRERLLLRSEAIMLAIVILALVASFVLPG